MPAPVAIPASASPAPGSPAELLPALSPVREQVHTCVYAGAPAFVELWGLEKLLGVGSDGH